VGVAPRFSRLPTAAAADCISDRSLLFRLAAPRFQHQLLRVTRACAGLQLAPARVRSGSDSSTSTRAPRCHEQCNDSLCCCCARRCPGVCHLRCLTPPQSTPPRGRWYCRFCKARKLTTGFKLVRKRCAIGIDVLMYPSACLRPWPRS